MTIWRPLLWLAVLAAALAALWSWRAAHPGPGRPDHAILVWRGLR